MKKTLAVSIGLVAFGMLSFWIGHYSGQTLSEPVITECQQTLYECNYRVENCIDCKAHLEAYTMALDDAENMLDTCKQVLRISDSNTCVQPNICRPPPEPEKKPRKKRRRWK